jgi:hypothetical protein
VADIASRSRDDAGTFGFQFSKGRRRLLNSVSALVSLDGAGGVLRLN